MLQHFISLFVSQRSVNMIQSRETLSVGDPAPEFYLRSHTGQSLRSQSFLSKPLVLFFYAKNDRADYIKKLVALRGLAHKYQQLGVNLLGINTESVAANRALVNKLSLPFSILADVNFQVSQAYQVYRESRSAGRLIKTITPTLFVINPNWKIAKIYDTLDPLIDPDKILQDFQKNLDREPPRQIFNQAPVLFIPNVLEREMCQTLIHVWETQGNVDSFSMINLQGKTIGAFNYDHKIRADHFIRDRAVLSYLEAIAQRRIWPEIFKAFHYSVTQYEDFRIGCYDSKRGGYFRPHRDNTTPGTAHRRFAMTLNLNVGEYEGGYLRFPEYAPHWYQPDTGSAVIFSCSLLHEATDVTAGRRFALLSFFYGESKEKMN